ncbi:hypothetical protein SLA2020_450170 [Shorea laevis]
MSYFLLFSQKISLQSTFVLEVNHVKSCAECQKRTTKALKKLHGVDSVSFDVEGRLKVSGNIDQKTIVGKFAEWGKKAELLSFRKGPVLENSRGACTRSKKCPSEPLSDSSDDDSDHVHKSMKNNAQVPMENSQLPEEKQSMKKSRNCFGFLPCLFPKKNGAKKEAPSPTTNNPFKWRRPRPYMPESACYSTYGRYPPVHGSGLAPPYHHYSHMRPPPLPLVPMAPPHVMLNYRPPLKANPMIYHDSHADNCSYRRSV